MTLCNYTDYANSCYPEPVAVTINQTIVEVGENSLSADQYVETVTGNSVTLPFPPLFPEGAIVMVDAVQQRYGLDYTLDSLGTITFVAGLTDAQVIVTYDYLTSGGGLSVLATGMSIPYMVTGVVAPPAGFLLMDGGALGLGAGLGYSATTYAALAAKIGTQFGGDGVANIMTQVVQSTAYVNGALEAFYYIIKT